MAKCPTRSPLQTKFEAIGRSHERAILERCARNTLGPSVIRVFAPNTKDDLVAALGRIDIDGLRRIKSERAYRRWFVGQLAEVARAIAVRNSRNRRVQPGYEWGHATKVLCIFVREVVVCSRYFDDTAALRIEPWLYVPIDGVVMKSLRRLGMKLEFSRIREIDTARKFFSLQDAIGQNAKAEGVPRVWLDDVWVEPR